MKKDTITAKIARSYDEERAYNIYMSEIIKWRQTTSLMLKLHMPRNKTTDEIKSRAQEIQRKLTNMSPEEEIFKSAMKNCLDKREKLISQLSV